MKYNLRGDVCSTTTSTNMFNDGSSTTSLEDILISKGLKVEKIGAESWVAILPGFRPPAGEEFTTVWDAHPNKYESIKMFGKDTLIPRYQQAYGHSYNFSGTVSVGVPDTPLIAGLKRDMNALVDSRFQFNMCLCNWYEPQHYIGPHSDDTRQLHTHSPIASISWGCSRWFVLKPKPKQSACCVPLRLKVEDGDLLIMGGRCQDTHKHEILKLKASEDRGNRINFTFRCFK